MFMLSPCLYTNVERTQAMALCTLYSVSVPILAEFKIKFSNNFYKPYEPRLPRGIRATRQQNYGKSVVGDPALLMPSGVHATYLYAAVFRRTYYVALTAKMAEQDLLSLNGTYEGAYDSRNISIWRSNSS
jgi:hypothetical protein